MPNNVPNPRETTNKSSFFIIGIIWLLTTAIKFRKAGLLFLLAMFFINCYFMLFDQQGYIAFLEHYFSPDGHISNIKNTFFRIQLAISFSLPLWLYITSKHPLNSLLNSSSKSLLWFQKKTIYISACILWLLISYLPFYVVDHKTIQSLAAEDSFYENAGFLFLLITSMCFLCLFSQTNNTTKNNHNIWFLLLGLLFFFGAGEEISWGQRLFDIATPEMLHNNIQHELNIHNLPAFSWDGKKYHFLSWLTSANTQFINFFFIYAFFIPLLFRGVKPVNIFFNRIHFPIPPAWASIFFPINYYLNQSISTHIEHFMIWPLTEINETAFSFFFASISLYMLTTSNLKLSKKDRIR